MATSIVSSTKNTWGFSPQSIPGLALWLDGADTTSITGTSSSVSAWRDKSGSGYTAVPFSGTIAQTTLNGQNALNFGTGVMRIASFTWTSSFTQIFVGYVTGGQGIIIDTMTSGGAQYGDYVYTGNGNLMNVNNPANTGILQVYDTAAGASTPVPTTNQWFIFCIGYGSTGTAAINYTLNGTVRSTTVSPATPPYPGGSATNPPLTLYINGTINGTLAPGGAQIAELIHFNTDITTPQRQQVEGYLAAKWGLLNQLPATHPYSAVVPFLPTQIAGCTLWLDAADSSTITGTSPVTAWADKSGRGNNATSASGATPTLSNINGVSAIVPGGGGFTGSITSGTPTLSCFAVAIFNAPDYGAVVGLAGPGYNDYATISGCSIFAKIGGDNRIYCTRADTNTPMLAVVSNAAFIASTVFDNTSNTIYLNGGSSQGSVASSFGNFGYTNFTIGSRCSGGRPDVPYWNGAIGEIVIYNAALSASQRNQVEQYLGQKWKIAVANAPSPGRYLIPTNRPFYPTDIPGCTLWIDAADRSSITFSSGSLTNISRWNDKSGQGNDFTVSEGTPVLSNTSYGKPTVVFPSNSQLLSISNASEFGAASRTIFVLADVPVGTQINFGTGSIASPYAYSNIGFHFANLWSGQYTWYYTPYTFSVNDIQKSNPTITTTTNIAYASYNSNTLTMTGRYGTIDGDTTKSFTNGTIQGPWYMGDRPDSGTTGYGGKTAFSGSICEIINFNTALTTAQRQQVEQYLTWKWGLPIANLPTGHPGKLMPAFSTNFTVKSISGCQLWLDGADTTVLTLSGTSVTSWGDKSGNGYSMNTLTPNPGGYTAIYPVIGTKINNQNTVFFSPTAGLKQSTVLTGVKNFYWIGRISSAGSSYTNPFYSMLGTDNVINTDYLPWLGSNYGSRYMNTQYVSSGIVGATASQYTTDANAVVNTGFSNVNLPSNGNVALLSVNGITEGNGTTSYQGLCYDRAAHIGWCGDLGEVLIFSNALTTQQHQQVEGYLAWKWGLQSSLPSTHAYAKFAP